MTAPALQVAIQGQMEVSADNLNTYVQACDNLTQLREFIGTDGMTVYVKGINQSGGIGPGMFRWVDGGTAEDDGFNVVAPTGASGIWQRTREPSFFPYGEVTAGASIPLSPGTGFVFVRKTTPSATELLLPIAGLCYASEWFVIVDSDGVALTYPITINGNGQLINGAATYVINSNYGTARLVFNTGGGWNLW